MTETINKDIYYLPLQAEIFQRREIRLLESMYKPHGYAYAYFYLKLCVESLATNGYLRMNNIPLGVEQLAAITNMDIDLVRSAVSVLESMGLMQRAQEDGALYIEYVAAFVKKLSGSPEAIRKRLERERKAREAALLLEAPPAELPQMEETNGNVTKCHAEVTDKSQESHVYINRKEKVNYIEEDDDTLNTASVSLPRAHAPAYKEVESFILENCPHVSPKGFYNYYSKRKWTMNGEPVKNWQNVAFSWEENLSKEEHANHDSKEMIALFAKYSRIFGASVPAEYFSNKKAIQVAIATETPLEGGKAE